MKNKPVLFSLIFAALFTSGCMQQEIDIPKEGDVVIWKHRPELIIKTKLGQRREHVAADARTDHLFYEPQYERFIGQFPIDYEPEPFPNFTEEEFAAFIAEYASKLHAVKSGHPIQFNLMLNGVKAKATDASPYGGKGIDDPNQVKVFLNGHGAFPIITKSGVKRAPYNTKKFFERELMKELDISSKKTKDGLDCYRFNNGSDGKRCFGHSTYPSISGFSFYVSPYYSSPGTKTNILVTSREFIYGGIRIQWFTHQQNIYRARDIDAAIWRLLDAWNISPIQNDNKI